jgi:hypothetical protein
MTRALGLLACVLLLCTAAGADIVTITDTMDHADNGSGAAPYFYLPGEIVDHQPYCRGFTENWSWTHDLTASAPKDAMGIPSATLSIEAWDVNMDEGEEDIIYANGRALGTLVGASALWTTTSFDLPQSVLDELWREGQVRISIDIDSTFGGWRVTLGSSTLHVNYTTDGKVPEPATIGLLGLGGLLIRRRKKQQGSR